MAQSSCVKCGGHSFELVTKEPRGSAYKINFIQCSSCGGVVGVVDYTNTEHLIRKLASALGKSL